eukprot:TRINITY_DN3808_c0_g1_i1.p1 TRINITY_DN3808_c0_g1~~TRINITY_DN3808_c0_g1_i1.p1  ORF type:complete len:237 (-),score=66.11 TRINITY_DN3808_c0_g1_i1:1105-1815(-)
MKLLDRMNQSGRTPFQCAQYCGRFESMKAAFTDDYCLFMTTKCSEILFAMCNEEDLKEQETPSCLYEHIDCDSIDCNEGKNVILYNEDESIRNHRIDNTNINIDIDDVVDSNGVKWLNEFSESDGIMHICTRYNNCVISSNVNDDTVDDGVGDGDAIGSDRIFCTRCSNCVINSNVNVGINQTTDNYCDSGDLIDQNKNEMELEFSQDDKVILWCVDSVVKDVMLWLCEPVMFFQQ